MDELDGDVKPEAPDDERDAVLAALRSEDDERRGPEPWAAAGLREAVQKMPDR